MGTLVWQAVGVAFGAKSFKGTLSPGRIIRLFSCLNSLRALDFSGVRLLGGMLDLDSKLEIPSLASAAAVGWLFLRRADSTADTLFGTEIFRRDGAEFVQWDKTHF